MPPPSYLYAENFRGFSKAVIPIEAVNFLVGENSTGKTSILALLNLLASPPFWFNLQFNGPDHEFGGFRDIMSTRTQQEFFTIGTIQRGKFKPDGIEGWVGVLASFRESEGLPLLASIAHIKGDKIICLRPHNESFKFLKIDLSEDFSSKSPEEVFSHFEIHANKSLDAYSDLPQKIPSGLPPIHLLSIVESVIGSEDKKSRHSGFMLPGFGHDLVWLAPIRTRPRRTYDGYGKDFSPEGEHTPYELRKRLKSEEKAKAFRAALESFGKSSGLFRKVTVHNLGRETSAPFELLVTLSGTPLRINSVGYGVSQALPVIVEMLIQPKNSSFAIQQPEVHLHPKAQAALGDLLFRMAESEQKRFVIETHSDFMIDRFRQNMRDEAGQKLKAQILFFERSGEGNRVTPIPIQSTGEYPTEQPNTFREFFLKEQLNILGL
jgi:hypothetical protein